MKPAPAAAQITTKSALASLEASLELFRELRTEMPIQYPLVFLMVAQRRGISAAELRQRTGLSQSAVSRALAALSQDGRKDERGLGLVVKTIDPMNPRAHAIYLSKAGRALAARLAEALGKPSRAQRGGRVARGAEAQSLASVARRAAPDAFAGAHWEVWLD